MTFPTRIIIPFNTSIGKLTVYIIVNYCPHLVTQSSIIENRLMRRDRTRRISMRVK